MLRRAHYSQPVPKFLQEDSLQILGHLVESHNFDVGIEDRNAWLAQIEILKRALAGWDKGHLLLEYTIPRLGKRVDTVLLVDGLVLVIEFKVGERQYKQAALDQVTDYALDLKNFHEASHTLPIIPVLVSTLAEGIENQLRAYDDLVYKPLKANASTLGNVLELAMLGVAARSFDPQEWIDAGYRPTPTIIEAAQVLYQGHSVADISRSEAGTPNLTRTTDAILEIIQQSKKFGEKAICFVTGVPGAGKTLAGLNIANARLRATDDEYAVFLSGNGPLVDVLREALARNDVETAMLRQEPKTKKEAYRSANSFIQNIHHFRDDALISDKPIAGKVVVIDEAQRAWTVKQTADFMRRKRGQPEFSKSEPEFLIGVLDRHRGWAVMICLIGGGQEINTGEAGLAEWIKALGKTFPNWRVYVSNRLTDLEYMHGETIESLVAPERVTYLPELHLGVSNRSFRSERVSEFIKAVLDLDIHHAQDLYQSIRPDYPIVLTRELHRAREWLRSKARGTERTGLLASSGGIRLRPAGIDVKSEIDVVNWFLNDKEDVRSSYALEQAATEFDIQGLELDWAAVAWDADFRLSKGEWNYHNFRGSDWQSVNEQQRKIYLKNAYRVLLTRARQGMIIFVPLGNDTDMTRLPKLYDETFEYLKEVGLEVI